MEWRDYVAALGPLGDRLIPQIRDPGSALSRQEAYRMIFAAIAQAHIGVVHVDEAYPAFVPMLNSCFNLAAPVPDFIYKYAPLDGAGTYRISGDRGSCRFVLMATGQGYYARTPDPGPMLDPYDLDRLTIGPDGHFSVILSNERPEGHAGDWWRLDPRATRMTVRIAACDWLNEIDPRLAIERLDVPAARPRLTASALQTRLAEVAQWAEYATGYWFRHLEAARARGLVNALVDQDYGHVGGVRGQVYLEGLFALEEDEALLLETEIPDAFRYWSVLVADDLFGTVDWVNRQSSLNDHQAKIDPDGRFRALVSVRDPGIANWLDTGGHMHGVIQFRWNQASAYPVPRLQRIKLADAPALLPSGTVRVDPEQRDAQLRARRRGAQMRRAW